MYGEITLKRLSLYGFLREVGFKTEQIPVKIVVGQPVKLEEYCDWRANKINPERYWDYPTEELAYLIQSTDEYGDTTHRRFALVTFADCDRLIELE